MAGFVRCGFFFIIPSPPPPAGVRELQGSLCGARTYSLSMNAEIRVFFYCLADESGFLAYLANTCVLQSRLVGGIIP